MLVVLSAWDKFWQGLWGDWSSVLSFHNCFYDHKMRFHTCSSEVHEPLTLILLKPPVCTRSRFTTNSLIAFNLFQKCCDGKVWCMKEWHTDMHEKNQGSLLWSFSAHCKSFWASLVWYFISDVVCLYPVLPCPLLLWRGKRFPVMIPSVSLHITKYTLFHS